MTTHRSPLPHPLVVRAPRPRPRHAVPALPTQDQVARLLLLSVLVVALPLASLLAMLALV